LIEFISDLERKVMLTRWSHLAWITAATIGYAHAQPAVPSHPKSEKDCDEWSQSFQRYYANKLTKLKEDDAKCIERQKVAGLQSKTITGQCTNVSASFSKQVPCGERDFWSKCFSEARNQGEEICQNRLAGQQPKRPQSSTPGTSAKAPANSPGPSEPSVGDQKFPGVDYDAAKRGEAKLAFDIAEKMDSIEGWKAFLKDHSDSGVYAEHAKKRLKELLEK
jgi:hypothetical protein